MKKRLVAIITEDTRDENIERLIGDQGGASYEKIMSNYWLRELFQESEIIHLKSGELAPFNKALIADIDIGSKPIPDVFIVDNRLRSVFIDQEEYDNFIDLWEETLMSSEAQQKKLVIRWYNDPQFG